MSRSTKNRCTGVGVADRHFTLLFMLVILTASVAHAFPASLPNPSAPSTYTPDTTTPLTEISNNVSAMRGVSETEEKQLTMNMCSIIYRILSTSSGTHHQRRLSLEAQQEVLEKCLRWRAYIPYPDSSSLPEDPYSATSDGGEFNGSKIPSEALEELRRIGTAMEKEELDARRTWRGWFGYNGFRAGSEGEGRGYLLLLVAVIGVLAGWCTAIWSSSHEMLKKKMASTASLRKRRTWSEKNSGPAGRLMAIIKE